MVVSLCPLVGVLGGLSPGAHYLPMGGCHGGAGAAWEDGVMRPGWWAGAVVVSLGMWVFAMWLVIWAFS
jgi:hypothetical protein